tara:strand:+ start:2269 stop:2496 length:228 start_codon:yes stop_codon:yes gene_type:complete
MKRNENEHKTRQNQEMIAWVKFNGVSRIGYQQWYGLAYLMSALPWISRSLDALGIPLQFSPFWGGGFAMYIHDSI